MTWAGLLLVVVYSPIGSPDLYKPQIYYYKNQGVNFNGAIENAPKVRGISYNNNADITIPNYNLTSKNYTNYSVSSSTHKMNDDGTVGIIGSGNKSITKQSGGGDAKYLGSGSFSSSRKKSNDNSVPQMGFNSLSSDLSLNGDSVTRQSVDYTPGAGGTDPGEDPLDPPIPVGDGFWFLLLLASGYAIWKMKLFR